MSLKIGFDISDLVTNRADGTTRYTGELARRLPRLSPVHEWIYFASGDVRGLDREVKKSPWPKYWTQSRLPWDLYKYRPDILFMPIQQIPLLRPGKMKTVATVHDLAFHIYPEQFTYKDWVLQHAFTAYVCRQADRIIAVSQATADDIARFYGRQEGVHVVHHGLDTERFRPPRDDNEKQQAWQNLVEKYPRLRKPYLLYVGQIQPRKNLIMLVEAFERLADWDKQLHLVLAGSHGWLNKPIFERVEKSSHKERIIMPGRVPDKLLAYLYWQAEVFVLPSLYEGFGMPVVEAMACGCPTVTSNVSSLPEVAGSAAELIDPTSLDSLTGGIERARSKREELSSKGIERSRQFSWDKTAQETLQVTCQMI